MAVGEAPNNKSNGDTPMYALQAGDEAFLHSCSSGMVARLRRRRKAAIINYEHLKLFRWSGVWDVIQEEGNMHGGEENLPFIPNFFFGGDQYLEHKNPKINHNKSSILVKTMKSSPIKSRIFFHDF